MYQAQKALTEPNNSRQTLWRYLSEERLVDLLETGELFFTHVPSFSDGLEGLLTSRSREHLIRWFEHQGSSWESAVKEVEIYERNSAHFHVNCWHMNNHESYLMWKAYADRGYAIRTHFERLKASFKPFEGVVSGGVMEYVDFERSVTKIGNVFNQVSTKDLPYKDERELRLFLWDEEPRNKTISYLPNGARIKVEVSMLVEGIVVSPLIRCASPKVLSLLKANRIDHKSSSINDRSRC